MFVTVKACILQSFATIFILIFAATKLDLPLGPLSSLPGKLGVILGVVGLLCSFGAIGININNLSKVMKLADPSDSITLQCEQDPSVLKITFENPKTQRSTEFALNLITLDVEHLSIPETEYSSLITINSGEFSKICKEL